MCYGIRWFKCKLKPPKNHDSIFLETLQLNEMLYVIAILIELNNISSKQKHNLSFFSQSATS